MTTLGLWVASERNTIQINLGQNGEFIVSVVELEEGWRCVWAAGTLVRPVLRLKKRPSCSLRRHGDFLEEAAPTVDFPVQSRETD